MKIDLRKYGKRTAIAAGAAFIAFHVIVLGGALGYGAHLVGFDVPFLDHSHDDCLAPMPDDKQKKEG